MWHVYLRKALMLVTLSGAALAAQAETRIELFNGLSLAGWDTQSFRGETRYQITTLNDLPVLHARSQASASGLVREIDIDLTKTPYLHWSWRVDRTLGSLDETTKAHDDYAARIYVVVSGGWLFWRTRAVNYVWASQQAQGSTWPNAYTSQARMLAVRSGEQDSGAWRHERRNVLTDLKRLFGADITQIHAVAIMTDSDNTGLTAEAYYGEIYFSDQ